MRGEDARVLVNEVEGHLLIAAARRDGRAAAARFTASFDWLTGAQRDEIERCFEAEYLALTRSSWQHTAERARAVRGEYEEAYRGLRRRLVAGLLLACAAALAVTALVALLL